jgi:hypothetical protein
MWGCSGGDEQKDVDASMMPTIDSAVVADVAPMADAALCVAPDLAPADDGTAQGTFDLVISELSVDANFVELFNRTDADMSLTALATHQWCSFPSYKALSTNSVTVPAKGYATIPYPFAGASGAGGELVLYKDANYTAAASVLDYLCWGTGGTSRKTVAETAGKWSGACAAAIPSGASLERTVGSAGTSAGDYAVQATPTPETCSVP